MTQGAWIKKYEGRAVERRAKGVRSTWRIEMARDIKKRISGIVGATTEYDAGNSYRLYWVWHAEEYPVHLTIGKGRKGVICGTNNPLNYVQEDSWVRIRDEFPELPPDRQVVCARCVLSYNKWQREGEMPLRLQMKLLGMQEL